ncbi:MAG: HNH endonuclease signature motif containing protein [Solirubrobacteraceae bacterium]
MRGRCREHATENRRRTRSVNDSFYSPKAWRLARSAQLFREPLCEHVDQAGKRCYAIAEHVHHRRPIEEGGARRDPANLMSVCASHHTAIHRQTAKRRP